MQTGQLAQHQQPQTAEAAEEAVGLQPQGRQAEAEEASAETADLETLKQATELQVLRELPTALQAAWSYCQAPEAEAGTETWQ